MDDSDLVCRLERGGDLSRDRQCVYHRKGAGPQPVFQRRPFDHFEHEPAHAARLFEAVDRADIGVIERRQYSRFSLEAGATILIGEERLRQDLDRHVAA
jgi:hypothetical protein